MAPGAKTPAPSSWPGGCRTADVDRGRALFAPDLVRSASAAPPFQSVVCADAADSAAAAAKNISVGGEPIAAAACGPADARRCGRMPAR